MADAPPPDVLALPPSGETWLAGSVPVHRWIVSPRGRALRPDAFLVLAGEEVVGVRVEPEGPGPARGLDILFEFMRTPLRGPPRRPAKILVADPETAAFLDAALAPAGVSVGVADVAPPLAERIRAVERQAGGGFPLRGLRDVPGLSPTRLAAFFSAAARFHRTAPWTRISDGEPFEATCDQWSRSTWYVQVMGSVGDVAGIALHPSWAALLAIYQGRATDPAPDALALAFGERTQIPFDDLDAIAEMDLEVDGNTGYPLVFRSRPGAEVARPAMEELEILETCLLAFSAFAAFARDDAPNAVVEVETSTGRRRVALARRA